MRKKKNSKIILVVISVTILLGAFIFLVFNRINESDHKTDNQEIISDNIKEFEKKQEKTSEYNEAEAIKAADKLNEYEFADNKLKLEGSVEYEGPDFESGSMEYGIYTGLKIRNLSEKYIKKADLKFETGAGETMNVHIEGVKPGQMVLAVAADHKGFSPVETFKITSDEIEFDEMPVNLVEGLNIQCSDRVITVENNTGSTVNDCKIYYKGREGEILMGGILHELSIDSLENNKSIVLKSESLLGREIEIVEIRY